MHNILPCLIAAALVTGSLAISLSPGAKANVAHLEATLRPEQAAMYYVIRRDRAAIYLWSLGLGLVVGFLYLALVGSASGHGGGWHRSCMFMTTVLLVTHIAYILWPKAGYMVQTLDTEEQRTAWVNVYRGMQLRQYSGMVVGAIGFLVYAQWGRC